MKLNVRTKLSLAFSVVFMLMMVMAILLFVRFGLANEQSRRNYTHGLVSTSLIGNSTLEARHVREQLLQILITSSSTERARLADNMALSMLDVIVFLDDYEILIEAEGAQTSLANFRTLWEEFTLSSQEVVDLALGNQEEEALVVLLGETDIILNDAINLLVILQDIEDNQARSRYDEAVSLFQTAQTWGWGLVIAAGISAFILATWLARTITNPLSEMANTATMLATGNLELLVTVDETRSDEVGILALAFNDMTTQLRGLVGQLESRVADRTRDLEIAADVSRQVSRVLDMKQLLPYLVNTTREGFKLAHVSIFLHQSETGILNLAASSGDIGQIMMEEGKQFHLNDKGLVPLTARTSEHQIINDVQASEEYFVNPLLPDTRSEAALPMRVGTRLIGVLDLQSNEVDHFSDEQLAVLTSLADQTAIAVQNAELFEEARVAREAAERSDQVKSFFLASMSHELRTPLNGIMNFTGVVADGMLGPVNEKQEKFLKDAVKNADHLLSLINDVLDISKIESGELKLFVEDDVDIATLYQEVARTGETLVGEKPVEIILDFADNLPSIMGDSRRIRQILLNIVSNACKFTREGSVTIGIRRENQDLLLWVKDTGPGIAPEDYEAVFETFLQTETGLRSGGGTGLGMPISRKLAEAHGGRLWIESEPGEGATFFVTLPIQSEELKMQIIA